MVLGRYLTVGYLDPQGVVLEELALGHQNRP